MTDDRKAFLSRVKLSVLLSTLLIVAASTICDADAASDSNKQEAYRLRREADEYLESKDLAKAEQLFRRANALDDRSAYGFYKLGSICSDQDRHREAALAYKRASEIDPNDTAAKVGLAHAYMELKDDRSALIILDALQRMKLDADDKEYTLSSLGYIQARSKRPLEAARAYKELVALKPNDPDYLYNLVDAYRDAGQYSAASNLATVYLARFPNAKNAPYVRSLTSTLTREKEPTRWYARWSEKSMPLKVCLLDPTKPVQGYQPNFRALVGRAIETWQTQSRKLVSFQFVQTPAHANIVVEWTDDIEAVALKVDPKDKEEHNIGYCRPEGLDASGNFTRTKVSILTIDPYDKAPYRDLVIESIALHELGHALGLPHSSTPGDVMFPWGQNEGDHRTRLSAGDVGRVVQLYSYKPAGVAKTAIPATKTATTAKTMTPAAKTVTPATKTVKVSK